VLAVIENTPRLGGRVRAPSSKSFSHRAIIAATLCQETTCITAPLDCDDVNATLQACRLLGAHVEKRGHEVSITGPVKLRAPSRGIDCGESASTLRFLIPVAALAQGRTVLLSGPQLLRRPVGPLVAALRKLGVDCVSSGGYPPVIVDGGQLAGGVTSIRGDVSSQFVTGLLFAAPLAEAQTEIKVTTRLESRPYASLTLDVLRSHQIVVDATRGLRYFKVPGKQRYRPAVHTVPGDYSSASFLMAAAVLTGSSIVVENLVPNQPDSMITSLLRQMGAPVEEVDNQVRVDGQTGAGGRKEDGGLRGIEVDARDIPDLVPVIAAVGCRAIGETRIVGAKRLRIKESDRLSSLGQELQKFGARVTQDDDSLTVNAPSTLVGARVDSHGDHRIAMACSVLGLVSKGTTEVEHAECVSKSYPKFYEDLRHLGGRVSVG
jgi:3-phosphoshikimate 1-carboxyvinyltransferase